LAKILLVAERKGGKISTRDAQLAFNQKSRPSSQMMRSWFSELALLGYGKIEKSKGGKTWIFENTCGSGDQLDQLPSNVMSASITATDLPSISCDQLDQLKLATDPTDRQLIHEVITSKPLQEEGLRATDPTDLLIDHLSEKIENQNVSNCVKFVKFAADQVATLYTEFSDRSALAPNLAKILLAAERKGGKISVRDAQLAFTPKFRPNAQMARSWFGELVALNYGAVKNSGKSLILEITAKSTDQLSTIASNSISVNVSSSTVSEPTTISCLQSPTATVDTVDEMIHSRIQSESIQGEHSRSIVDDDLLFATSEKIENQKNVSDCIKFIRAAIESDDPQLAKDIQAVLGQQAPQEKQQIWDALTAEEKFAFRCLINKSSTNTPQTPTNKELKGVDESGSDDDQLDQLKAAQELIPIEKELLAISNLEDFSDFADWLEDPQYLKNLCLSLGDQPEKLWLAHQIQNLLNFEDKATAVEVIADFRDHFSKEILEAAGKLAVAGFYKIGARALLKCPK
jgi:hypothetical protein